MLHDAVAHGMRHDVRRNRRATWRGACSCPTPEARAMRDEGPVLVVDDDADFREVVRCTLEAAGYAVRCAEDGRAALELLERERPALVLLDLAMPRMAGEEVLRTLRARA